MKKKIEPLGNINKPIKKVKHADLERIGDARYKSKCPFCPEGILPVRRDQNTLRLQYEDACYYCGQRVLYTDAFVEFAEGR